MRFSLTYPIGYLRLNERNPDLGNVGKVLGDKSFDFGRIMPVLLSEQLKSVGDRSRILWNQLVHLKGVGDC